MSNHEEAQRWLERESKAGNELAAAYTSFLSAAPAPVREHWLKFLWEDVVKEANERNLSDARFQ